MRAQDTDSAAGQAKAQVEKAYQQARAQALKDRQEAKAQLDGQIKKGAEG